MTGEQAVGGPELLPDGEGMGASTGPPDDSAAVRPSRSEDPAPKRSGPLGWHHGAGVALVITCLALTGWLVWILPHLGFGPHIGALCWKVCSRFAVGDSPLYLVQVTFEFALLASVPWFFVWRAGLPREPDERQGR